MKINLTTQTSILTISTGDLDEEVGYLYKYFSDELEKSDQTNIKTLAYNAEIEKLVLLIFDKGEGFTQKEIILGETISGND